MGEVLVGCVRVCVGISSREYPVALRVNVRATRGGLVEWVLVVALSACGWGRGPQEGMNGRQEISKGVKPRSAFV